MDTSGTVGATRISVQTLIDHGARRCGKLAEELTSEQVTSSKESLFFLLSNLANRGIQYWAIDTEIFGTKPDQAAYYLPEGSIDALNVLYRNMNRPTPNNFGGYSASSGNASNAFDNNTDTKCVQTSPNGDISVDFGIDNSIYSGSIGILPGTSGSFHILFEVSDDGLTWSQLYDCGVETWVDNTWLWYNIDPGSTSQFYRMRETGGNTLNVREFYIGNMSREVPMARLNRDDYTSLPNKNFTANQPYQFYFERTIPKPSLNLWPVPSSAFVQIVVWYSRQIQDVGALSGELEIPQRWFLAIQSMLAHQMSLELPMIPMDRIAMLKGQADDYLYQAEQEERDKSPIYFAPNISVYTR
jgi:hypothetical protein